MTIKSVKLLLIIVTTFSVISIKAQNNSANAGKYGKDSSLCIKNLSLYLSQYKQNNFLDAYSPWQWVFCNCPESSINIMNHGCNIINFKLKNTKDENIRRKLLDSLFIVYNTSMILFPKEKGVILGRKANDYIKYVPLFWDEKFVTEKNLNQKKSIGDSLASAWENAYKLCKQAVFIEGNNSLPSIIDAYLNTAEKCLESNKIEITDLFDVFDTARGIVDINIVKYSDSLKTINNIIDIKINSTDSTNTNISLNNKTLEQLKKDTAELSKKLLNYKTVKNNLYLKFENNTKCLDIEKIYKKKLDDSPNDIALLEKISKIMYKKSCISSALFDTVVTQRFEIQKTAESTFFMGLVCFHKNKLEQANILFEKILNEFHDEVYKTKTYLMLVYTNMYLKKYSIAREYALKYIELNPTDGTPYLLIGDMYAQSATICGSNKLSSHAVYWAAVDKYNKAIAIDDSKKQEANQRIKYATSQFPTKELVLFNKLKKGQSYAIGCWIEEKTIVR
jgi:tetratricopeptide (TPR) repeat protein